MEKAEAEPPVDLWLPIACVLVRNYSEIYCVGTFFPLSRVLVSYNVLLGCPIEQTKERCAPLFAFCFPSCCYHTPVQSYVKRGSKLWYVSTLPKADGLSINLNFKILLRPGMVRKMH